MQNKILPYIVKLPELASLLFCLILAVIIGALDYATGDYGITVLYIIPIYATAKLIGIKWCYIVTSVCIIETVTVAFLIHRGQISLSEIYIWNALMQSLELTVLGYCISKVTSKLK